MNLFKKLRKHQTKILVTVLVIIMFSFVGGMAMRQLLLMRSSSNKPIATYGNGIKLRQGDFSNAHSQIEMLRMIGAERYMFSADPVSVLVGQLIFQNDAGAYLDSQFKRMVQQGQLLLTDEQIDAFFKHDSNDGPMLWILLLHEANQAGCAVSREQAINIVKHNPKIFSQNGDPLATLQKISESYNVSQDSIMDVFARLLSIAAYARTITSTTDVTLPQLKSQAGFSGTKLNAEYVRFAAQDLADTVKDVDQDTLQQQFDKYKDIAPGNFTQDNPYGFGYKLPARVRIEYLLVNISDIENAIDEPTEDEMEEYYDINKSKFIDEEASKASDDNPLAKPVYKPYAQVARDIRSALANEKKTILARQITSAAMDILNKKMAKKNVEDFTSADYKEYAVSYADAAKQLTEKFKIPFYTGTTGYLDTERLIMDPQIGRLEVQTSNISSVPLVRLAFSVSELDMIKLGIYEGKSPKLYQNIGPLASRYARVTGIVRIVDALKPQAPESIDTEYSIRYTTVGTRKADDTMLKVHDIVEQDCKNLMALDQAKIDAEKLLNAGDDWKAAIEQFNKDNKTHFSVSNYTDRPIPSDGTLIRLKYRSASLPGATTHLTSAAREKAIADSFVAVADSDQPKTLEVKPDMAWYAVRNVSVTTPTLSDYLDNKVTFAASFETLSSMEAAIVHLTEDNIIARTKFKYINRKKDEKKADQPQAQK